MSFGTAKSELDFAVRQVTSATVKFSNDKILKAVQSVLINHALTVRVDI